MGKIVVRVLVFFLAFAIGAYALIQYGFFRPEDAGLVSFKLSQPDFLLEPWIYVLYAHIATGAIALLIGPFQLFLTPVHPQNRRRHQVLGYVYVGAISISGLVNLYVSVFATGGWKAALGFFLLDGLWIFATWFSLLQIARKDIQAHKDWMLRSYALTFAAVTLRLWLPIMVMLFNGNFIPAYQLAAWICWVVNLLVIEVVIRLRASRSKEIAGV